MIQNLGDTAKAVLRMQFIVIQAYLRKPEISKKQPNLTPKATRKRTKPKISSRKKNHKYQSKRNEVETEKNNGKDQ